MSLKKDASKACDAKGILQLALPVFEGMDDQILPAKLLSRRAKKNIKEEAHEVDQFKNSNC